MTDPSKSTEELLCKLEDRVKELEDKMTRVNTAFFGDEKGGITGIAERVVQIEKKQRIHNVFTIKVMTAWTMACGFIAFFKDKLWP